MSGKNFISEYLSDESLNSITQAIGEIEKRSSGEIRICIKKRTGYFEKKYSARELALKQFFKLKMNNTRDRTSVLIFLIFKDRKFEIIADEGINSKISTEHWNYISEHIREYFSKESYSDGILYSIGKIGEILIREFPVKDDDNNELPNDVIFNP